MNIERYGAFAISNMVKHLGRGDAEGNLGTLRALLRMPTNLSQAFIWWKAWMHTEYTPCTELCKLVAFFSDISFSSWKAFWCSLWLPPKNFDSQLNKYLIQVPLCFKAHKSKQFKKQFFGFKAEKRKKTCQNKSIVFANPVTCHQVYYDNITAIKNVNICEGHRKQHESGETT